MKWMTDPKLASLAVIDESKVTSPESWIYLIITATSYPFGIPSRSFLPVAHPVSDDLFAASLHRDATIQPHT
jgi:hypothetical protein